VREAGSGRCHETSSWLLPKLLYLQKPAANKLKLLIDNEHARKLLITIKEKTKSDIEKWGKSFAYLTCQ
jgi:hypothetical protein